MADLTHELKNRLDQLIKAADHGDAFAVLETRERIEGLFRRVRQHGGTDDPRVMDPGYNLDHHEGSQPEAQVKRFVVGQRVRLDREVRTELAKRIGELGTVTGMDQRHVQVDLDEGGTWWLSPDWVSTVEVS